MLSKAYAEIGNNVLTRKISAFAALFLLSSSAALGQELTRCDTLAAFPFDPQRVTQGVTYERIPDQAIKACEDAAGRFPTSGRVWFQLGRVLERVGRVRDAIDAYRKAMTLGHPGGANNLGELHRQGKGLTRDPAAARRFFALAAEQSYPEGAFNLANALLAEPGYEYAEVVRLLGIAAEVDYPGSRRKLAAMARAPASPPGDAYSVSPGTPLRAELMNALRPSVEVELNPPIEFRAYEIKVAGDWAFMQVMPQRPGGQPVRVLETPRASHYKIIGNNVHTEAVLHRTAGIWRVEEAAVGSTDVWFLPWCDRLPKALFRRGVEKSACDP
ncbi:hypothetical protein ABEG18_19085 [Alsobacter sp. KACC 23698]|uniref:Tetratricopeptide repeat protein n=1 Tax=Alsobacter sp. KACC 23698 TaxID=3149229 RepID=A0AAU7JC93_9HYPH